MNSKLFRSVCASAFVAVFVTGCSSNADNQDLIDFMEKTKRVQPRAIEPIPAFVPYEAFNYEAGALRSPFNAPVKVALDDDGTPASEIRPIENRVTEALELFNLGDLLMVGTMTQDGNLIALVRDNNGRVHKVQKGNYMGRSHGQIKAITAGEISITEIVPNGPNNWIERPRSLLLVTASQ